MNSSVKNKFQHLYINETLTKKNQGKYMVITANEKKIIDLIKKILVDHEIDYFIDPHLPKIIELQIESRNKLFPLSISLTKGMVEILLLFPFRVQVNATAIMSLYLMDIESENLCIKFEKRTGKLMIKNSYYCSRPSYFDDRSFWECIQATLRLSDKEYSVLAQLSVGMLSLDQKRIYKQLFERAIALCDGIYEKDAVYGTDQLFLLYPPGKNVVEKKEHEPKDKVDDILTVMDRICMEDAFFEGVKNKINEATEPEQVKKDSTVETTQTCEEDMSMEDYLSSLLGDDDGKKGSADGDE